MRRLLLGSMVGLSLGACGRDLPQGAFGCPEHQLVCDGICTDVSSDADNCGACGTLCDAGEDCLAGRCRPHCEAPDMLCSEGCVDLRSDVDNCGSCGNECSPGARCVDGACSAIGCPSGQQRCGDVCVDTTTDSEHCGECFAACDAGERCDNNVCVSGCGARAECSGRCVNLESDENHCGECGHRCGSGQICEASVCSGCPDGSVRCDDDCVDPLSNPDHCGACDMACAAGAVCEQGMCSCSGPGFAVCDGYCTDVSTDPNHCGSCGSLCGATCVGGLCCYPPSVVCGNLCVDVISDPNHCGECGLACDAGQSCVRGRCESVCPSPEVLCGNACVDVRNDPSNCGFCDVVCEQGEACRAGRCVAPGDGCDFGGLAYPIYLNGGLSVSDITVDENCNLYVGMDDSTGVIYSIDGSTGDVRLIAELRERIRGLVYRPEDGALYGTSLDRLVTLRPDGSELRVLDDSVAEQYLNGMTIAPGNWQPGNGYFVVAQSTGDVVIYNPDTLEAETFVSTSNRLSDVEFSGQQLYVASFDTSEILKITPSGVISTFATLPCGPDGLTVEPDSRLFASCGNTGGIYEIDIDTAEVSWLGQFALNSNWAPSGLLWQPGVLLVVEESSGLNALFL